jgi:phenylalanyl-tRNA synthetase beta chain
MAERFDCKADVYVADILWENALTLASNVDIRYKEISRFPAVQRDLAFLVDRYLAYNKVEETVLANRLPKLRQVSLFDVFESDKLGAGKKSMALSFTFLDEEKTLTDKEIDDMMNKIIVSLEKELNAEIRKN